MDLTQRITHLPRMKPEVVAGQIHDADGYVVLIWLSATKLSVMTSTGKAADLDPKYTLGTVFTVRIVASGGFIDVYHNGALKAHHATSRTGCYFKAGCYTQANESTGDAPDAYGQVEVIRLNISHDPTTATFPNEPRPR
jgi:poly(beta-D-mannuronate) lyase